MHIKNDKLSALSMQKEDTESTSKTVNFSAIFHKILIFLPLGVMANILFCYFTIDPTIFNQLNQFSIHYFVLSLFLGIVPWFTHMIRLKVWTHFLGERIGLIENFRIAVGHDLGAAISPTSVGGEAIKIGMLAKNGVRMSSAISLTLLGRIEDVVFLIFILISILLFAPIQSDVFNAIDFEFAPLNFLYVLSGLVLLMVVYKLLPKRWTDFIRQLFIVRKVREITANLFRDIGTVFNLIKTRGKTLFLFTSLLTIIQWISKYLILYTLLLSLGIQENPMRIIALQWIVFMLMFFIPTPGASVGAEATFYLIFSTILTNETLALVTIGWRFLTFYSQLTLGSLIFTILSIPSVRRIYKPGRKYVVATKFH